MRAGMDGLIHWPLTWADLLWLPGLIVGFTVHELAHATLAYVLGDTSQEERGRLSFNPLKHISWLGMVFFFLFRFAWAKPVAVDPHRFRLKNRQLGMLLVSVSGALCNLLVAGVGFLGIMVVALLVWQVGGVQLDRVSEFLWMPHGEPALDARGVVLALGTHMVRVNGLLAFFNLLPLPGLDGFIALMTLFGLIRERLKGKKKLAPATGKPSPAQIHLDIGLEYHRQEEWAQAIARYRQAVANDATASLAYYNMGLAYVAQKRFGQAANAFRAAVKSVNWRVRTHAEFRLKELEHLEERSQASPAREEALLQDLPSPLTPEDVKEPWAPDVAPAAPGQPDPQVLRRVGIGAGVGLVVALGAWVALTVLSFNMLA
jgi:Zn-dependent protease